LNDQIAQKKAVFGDRHPDLAISYSQLNDLNRQIEVERKKNIDTAKSEYEAQLEQQNSLEKQLRGFETQMLVDGQALVRLQELQRDAEANKNIYEQFLSRFKTTNEQRLLQNSQTKIASPAIPPIKPTRPPLVLLLAALAIASMLTSTAIIAVIESGAEPAARSPAPPAAAFSAGQRAQRPASTVLQPVALPNFPVWVRIPSLSPGPISVWQEPIAATSELDLGIYLRPLVERIDHAPARGGKVVLLLSVGKSSGGNTVARSLNRTAVKRGMLSVLIQVQPEFVGADLAATERQNGITIAGVQSVNELLSGGQADSRTADDIRSEFDLIVVHATSLALQPDAITLAARSDLIILVVRESELESGAMERITAALSGFRGVPTGLVINYESTSSVTSHHESKAFGLTV
jgi:hypothetical protein